MKVQRLLNLALAILLAGCSGGSSSKPDATILEPDAVAIPGEAEAGSSSDVPSSAVANDALGVASSRDSGALGDAPDYVSPDASSDLAAPDAPGDASSADGPVFAFDARFTGGGDTAPAVLKPNVRVLTAQALQGATVGDTSIVLGKAGNEELSALPAGMILGSFDGSFLRRVVSVSSDAATIAIQTEDASLAEAVEEGEIETSFVFGTEDEPYQEIPSSPIDFAVDGGAFPILLNVPAPMPLSLGVDFSGKTLYSSGAISLVLAQAGVKYVPTCTVRMAVKKSRIVSFSTSLQGSLKMAFEPALTASASYTTPTAKANLWTSPTYRFFQTIGALPVGEEVRLVLDGKINATASGKVSVSGGVDGGGKLSLGVTYRNGAWSVAASAPLNFSAIEPTASGEASLGYTVTITPRIEVVFFPLNKHLTNIGVSLYTDAASTLEGKYESKKCPRALDWKASINLKGMAEAGLSVLDRELLDYGREVFNETLQLGSGSIEMGTEGEKCAEGEKAYCGKNDVFMCCPPERPYFCDTGNAENAGCWPGSAQGCDTITKCDGRWYKCQVDGEIPYCGAVTKSFNCCDAEFPYFLDMNTIAGDGSCWQAAIDPSTITDCGDEHFHACELGSGGSYSCAEKKCVKPSGS